MLFFFKKASEDENKGHPENINTITIKNHNPLQNQDIFLYNPDKDIFNASTIKNSLESQGPP